MTREPAEAPVLRVPACSAHSAHRGGDWAQAQGTGDNHLDESGDGAGKRTSGEYVLMFPEIPRLRRRRGEGRRLSTRILVSQLAILAVTSVIGFVLFAWAQRAQLDKEYEGRALAIAKTAAADP